MPTRLLYVKAKDSVFYIGGKVISLIGCVGDGNVFEPQLILMQVTLGWMTWHFAHPHHLVGFLVCFYPVSCVTDHCPVMLPLVLAPGYVRWIQNLAVLDSNPIMDAWFTAYFMWARNLHTIALGLLSLAIPPCVHFPWITNPEPGNVQHSWCQAEG